MKVVEKYRKGKKRPEEGGGRDGLNAKVKKKS